MIALRTVLPLAAFLAALPAWAGNSGLATANPTWKAECGACHVAYPPRLLPAESWRRLMGRLDQHFGVDASVDGAAAREIGAFLDRNAPHGAPAGTLRITETTGFVREHDEVPARIWKSPAVRSPANCGACHLQAERGDFGERQIRIPR